MCRIFGNFSTDSSPHELRLASAAQRHGGPDAQSIAFGPGWSLGSNRLAIMDPGHGEQPYRLGDTTVVFNGEIYNHAELRATLQARGHVIADHCDGSVIPALYLDHGPEFVELLDGMYSFAIIDLRAEPTLVLGTDDVGMKSLYYHWNPRNQEFYFASEIPGLLSFRAVGTDLWLSGLEEYLATKTPFGEQTMFEQIRVLPPASTAIVNRSRGLRIFRRDTAVNVNSSTPTDAAEAATEADRLLAAEVTRLTRADVPICAVTSGGLDSSYITALASRVVPELHTFNIAYVGDWPGDERHFATEVAQRFGTRHHQVEIDPLTFPDLLPDVVWHLGQPNADPITLSTFALFRAVREAGFKVALTGDASDEFFGGYDRLRHAVGATGDWANPYLDALAAIPRELRFGLYSPEYRDYLAGRATARDGLAAVLTNGEGRTRLAALSEVEVVHRLPAYHLRRVDHLSMAQSVEVRLPFCQRSVTSFAGALSDEHKISGGRGKKVLYGAAASTLPSSVLNRPKQPFTLPITAMLHEGAALTGYARDLLHPDRLARHGLLDPKAVGGLLARQLERPDDHSALAIWSLLVFETWLEQYGVGVTAGCRPLLEVAP